MNKNILLILTLLSLFSCNDDFLDRYPETEITKENFFNTASDLEIYTNGFYSGLSASYDDIGSDNIAMREAKDEIWDLTHGAVSSLNMGGWAKGDWSALRSINFFLENSLNSSATKEEAAHYRAIAKFFRAQFYINKVKTFSDVPWISKAPGTTDQEILFKTQDPRGVVVDSIVADLQYASTYINVNNSQTRISKFAALASLARFALYEGTFRKYGMLNSSEAAYLTEKGASDYNKLLQIARDASQKIMDEGGFSLAADYEGLFNSTDLTGNPEIILFLDFDKGRRMHNSYTRLDWQYDLSQNLVDEYLKIDGTAYSRSELDTLQYKNTFADRDPRLMATVSYPGYTRPGDANPHVAKISFGGLGQIKFTPKEPDAWTWEASYNDLPVFRYGEILLINAEAHAELGTLTNTVLSNTVNLIRSRAGLNNADVTLAAVADPVLDSRYANIQANPKGAALEIRRERRVELACEGLRHDDLMRWHLGDAIFTVNGKPENLQRGMYVPKMTMHGNAKFTLLEVTGDDVEDILIAETAADIVAAEAYYNNSDFYKGLNKVSLEETFSLKNGDEGHIIWKRELDDPGTFVEPKYYYRPVPQSEILISGQLVQHQFWK